MAQDWRRSGRQPQAGGSDDAGHTPVIQREPFRWVQMARERLPDANEKSGHRPVNQRAAF